MSKDYRWVKVAFEGASVPKIIKAFPDEAEGCDVNERCVVLLTTQSNESIRDQVWKLNGGAFCEVSDISDIEADKYC